MNETFARTLPSTVSATELQCLLQAHLNERGGRRVAAFERRPSEYRSSYELDEIDALLDDGSVLRLVWKATSRGSLSSEAIEAKPEFLYDPLREIEVYRRLLAPTDLRTAACYGAIADGERDCYGLLLERVEGLNLAFIGEIAIWQQAARSLAQLHNRLADFVATTGNASHLLNYDRRLLGVWIERAVQFNKGGEPVPRSAELAGLARIAERYDRVVDRLVDLPTSLIHGEFFPSNVLVDGSQSPPRVCPIDWELAGFGPRWLDLAALVAGNWTDDERHSMQRAYYAESSHDCRAINYDEFTSGVNLCRLHLAVQMLGWSATWRPQPRLSHDWLADAINLSAQLKIV